MSIKQIDPAARPDFGIQEDDVVSDDDEVFLAVSDIPGFLDQGIDGGLLVRECIPYRVEVRKRIPLGRDVFNE